MAGAVGEGRSRAGIFFHARPPSRMEWAFEQINSNLNFVVYKIQECAKVFADRSHHGDDANQKPNPKMNLIRTTETKIKPGQILATRATGDHEIIYSLRVISRTPKTAQIEYDGKVRKAKIDEWNGVEFICPQRYSMCPSFYANQVLAA